MAKADRERLEHQTSVWVPRNAVYLQTEEPVEEKSEGLENFGKAQRAARDVQYKSSLAAVAAQQAFASAHTAEWEKRTGDDDKNTYDTMMSVWEPRRHVMLQIDTSDDKKKLENMGKSSDVALIAGRKVADKVVATQEATMATNNSLHAAAMAKAANDSTAHKTSVWVPRNAVYA